MASTTHDGWPVRHLVLDPPQLKDLVSSIQEGLDANFETATVSVERSPDLRKKPFYLAAPGLSGNTRIADVGGPEFVEPLPDMSKRYDFLSVSKSIGLADDKGIIIGAGAGPLHYLKTNTEYMPNLAYEGREDAGAKSLNNLSRYAKIDGTGSVVVDRIPNEVTEFALLINVFVAEGVPGDLIHIKVRGRKGELNFPEAIQAGLKSGFGDRLISMGGVFAMSNGKANLHAMAHSTDQPFKGEIKHPWLRWFDCEAPLIGLTVFHSGDDKGHKLRSEHTHCFSIDGTGLGGHYHGDIDETKETVEYEAWLNTAAVVYRIDQPPQKQ